MNVTTIFGLIGLAIALILIIDYETDKDYDLPIKEVDAEDLFKKKEKEE